MAFDCSNLAAKEQFLIPNTLGARRDHQAATSCMEVSFLSPPLTTSSYFSSLCLVIDLLGRYELTLVFRVFRTGCRVVGENRIRIFFTV